MTGYLAWGGIVAVVTIIVGFGGKLKSLVTSLQKMWLIRIDLDKTTSSKLYQYCFKNMTCSFVSGRTIIGHQQLLADTTKTQLLLFDLLYYNTVVFRKGWRLIWLSPGKWFYNPNTSEYERSMICCFPRFMWKFDNILKDFEMIDSVEENISDRFRIQRLCGTNRSSPIINLDDSKRADHTPGSKGSVLTAVKSGLVKIIGRDISQIDLSQGDPFAWYEFDSNVLDAVRRADEWYELRSWYTAKRIPWTRGWLLYGKPGAGKTLLATCVAQHFKIPLFIFDLQSMSNNELVSSWEKASSESPCVILLEDFDNVFDKRKTCGELQDAVSFDCLLNCLSGANVNDGVFTIITANDIAKIDDAIAGDGIVTRPGRIDEVIEVGDMSEECRRRMATKILGHEFIDDIIDRTQDMTAAQFIEVCVRQVVDAEYLKRDGVCCVDEVGELLLNETRTG